MKVNNINQSAAESSFKAKKLAVVTSKLSKNTPPDIIEIYSLSKKDAEFAQKSLAIFNNQTITPDKKGVFYYEPKKSLVNFFKSIIKPIFQGFEYPLIAIKNNKEICGTATYFNIHAKTRLKDFMVWNDSSNNAVRRGLMYTIMNKSQKNDAIILAPSGLQEKTANFFKSMGFKTPKNSGGFKVIEDTENIKDCMNKISENSTMKIQAVKDGKEYDLQKIFEQV